MVSTVLFSILVGQGGANTIDIPLHEIPTAERSYLVYGQGYSQPADDLKAIKGYRLPSSAKPTHSGTIEIGDAQIVYYAVRNQKLFRFDEIGFDFNHNKAFEKTEIAQYAGENPKSKGNSVFAFKTKQTAVARVTAYHTVSLNTEPACLLQGSATFAGNNLSFTVSDSNMDGRFTVSDTVAWIDKTIKHQPVGSLFALPDGKYYNASFVSSFVLRFTPDPRPTGTVSVKNGRIELADLLFKGEKFSPAIANGVMALPTGNYQLQAVAYKGNRADGAEYMLSFIPVKEKDATVEAGKDLCLDPGPVNKAVLAVDRSGKGFSLAMGAQCENGDRLVYLFLSDGKKLKELPEPVVEIFDPSGSKVSEIKLEYG